MGYDESKLSFVRTSLRFYSALAILEPQIYVVVEQFGAENISLHRWRLELKTFQKLGFYYVSSQREAFCDATGRLRIVLAL